MFACVGSVEDEIDELLDEGADDVDLRLARLEALLESMPLLLSSVVLRQNPHNVHEWHKRAKVGPGRHCRWSSKACRHLQHTLF